MDKKNKTDFLSLLWSFIILAWMAAGIAWGNVVIELFFTVIVGIITFSGICYQNHEMNGYQFLFLSGGSELLGWAMLSLVYEGKLNLYGIKASKEEYYLFVFLTIAATSLVFFQALKGEEKQSHVSGRTLWTSWEDSWDSVKNELKGDSHIFYELYKQSYNTAREKIEKNNRWNFWYKNAFVIGLVFFLVVQIRIGFWCKQHYSELNITKMITMESILIICISVFGLIISKLLDINKYQETWARHRYYQTLREQEMLRFINQTGKYNRFLSGRERAEKFAESILEIEKGNIEKFTANLENKEQSIMNHMEMLQGFGIKK